MAGAARSMPNGGAGFAGERVLFEGALRTLSRPAAEALVRRHGGTVVRRVEGRPTLCVVGDDEGRVDGVTREGTARIAEREFCRRAGVPSDAELRERFHGLRSVRERYAELREDRLRYLERLGLVRPVHVTRSDRYVSFESLSRLAAVHARLASGTPFRAVVQEWLAEVRGQLSLDLRPRTRGAAVIPFPSGVIDAAAESSFRRGYHLESQAGREDEAAAAYEEALELDPQLVPALINLANLHYLRDQATRALELYRRAEELDREGYFQIPFNLGNIALDREDLETARGLYERALALEPDYADAHLYLAIALEKLGRSKEARPHWRAYRELEPDGEWVRLARELERWG